MGAGSLSCLKEETHRLVLEQGTGTWSWLFQHSASVGEIKEKNPKQQNPSDANNIFLLNLLPQEFWPTENSSYQAGRLHSSSPQLAGAQPAQQSPAGSFSSNNSSISTIPNIW